MSNPPGWSQVSNADTLFTKIIYPVLFEKEPESAINRVADIIKNEFSAKERTELMLSLRSGHLGADHQIVSMLRPICDKTKLVKYLSLIEERLEAMSEP